MSESSSPWKKVGSVVLPWHAARSLPPSSCQHEPLMGWVKGKLTPVGLEERRGGRGGQGWG